MQKRWSRLIFSSSRARGWIRARACVFSSNWTDKNTQPECVVSVRAVVVSYRCSRGFFFFFVCLYSESKPDLPLTYRKRGQWTHGVHSPRNGSKNIIKIALYDPPNRNRKRTTRDIAVKKRHGSHYETTDNFSAKAISTWKYVCTIWNGQIRY